MSLAGQLAELMNQGPAPGEARLSAPVERHLEQVAQAVYHLLGREAAPRFGRRLREHTHLIEDAEDLQQVAALAFITAYREGRIRPDEHSGVHTASSVSAYLWGACNRIFVEMLRRSRMSAELSAATIADHAPLSGEGLFSELVAGHVEDSEERLWEVLEAVIPRCKPEDIVMTYLHGCGFTVAEIRQMMQVSVNTPSNALKRVGSQVRSVLELE